LTSSLDSGFPVNCLIRMLQFGTTRGLPNSKIPLGLRLYTSEINILQLN